MRVIRTPLKLSRRSQMQAEADEPAIHIHGPSALIYNERSIYEKT